MAACTDEGGMDPEPPGPDAGTSADAGTVAPAPPPDGFRSEYASVNGIEMHYVIGGSGDPVVLLHGWPQTWYEWHRIMPTLAAEYTVIAPDLRGAGASDKPPSENGYDKHLLAQDIYELVDTLDYDRIILVGHDIGMMVAYAYAVDYGETVRGVALLDAPIPGIEPFWSQILTNPLSWHFGFHAESEISELLVKGREREYITSFYRKFAANPNAFTEEEIAEFTRAYSAPGAMAGGFAWYRAFATDVEDNIKSQETKLTMPVLALGGEFASGAFMVPMAEAVAEDVRGGPIAGAGHWLAEEKPDELTAALQQFFVEVRQAEEAP